MAGFGRSNSLSINTGSSLFGNNASSGQQSAGLFGSSTAASSQPATAGGLFGSTSQPQTGGLFGGGGAPAAPQPPQTGSLFGGQQQTSQPQSAGLFGNLNKPAPAAGGLFGSSTAQSQPQQSGGLFGGALGGAQNQTQQTTSQSGGLFNLGQPQKPSLFGNSTQQTTTPSLFGNINTQQNQTSTPSLFGATQQPQQQNTMFNQSQGLKLGGSSIPGPGLGAGQQAVQITIDNIKGTTRYSDLHVEIQRQIMEVDARIQRQIDYASQIREILPQQGEKVATVAPDVAYVEEKLSTVELGLDNDSANISHLKEVVKKDAEDASLSFRAIINLNLPDQFHYGNRTNLNASAARQNPIPSDSLDDANDPSKPVDLIGYFQKRTDDLGRTLDLYQGQILEIEAHLRTMEVGTVEKAQQLQGSRNGPREQRRELIEALRAIEGAILDSAKKVGQVRDSVTKETLGSVGAALVG